jgi:hypothetical protein
MRAVRIMLRCKGRKKGKECRRFVCELAVLDPHPHVGPFVRLSGIACKHCGSKSEYQIRIRDKDDVKTVEQMLRERMWLPPKPRQLPSPKERR